jgi:hypothetical protein
MGSGFQGFPTSAHPRIRGCSHPVYKMSVFAHNHVLEISLSAYHTPRNVTAAEIIVIPHYLGNRHDAF